MKVRNTAVLALVKEGFGPKAINSLNREDVDLVKYRVKASKRGQKKIWHQIHAETIQAIKQWFIFDGIRKPSHPLFIALDRAHYGTRLSTVSIQRNIMRKTNVFINTVRRKSS